MNTDEKLIQQIDRLIAGHSSFALYRLPNEQEPYLVMQTEAEPEQLRSPEELNGRQGFVMAPFRANNNCPILLIKPDCFIFGKEAIANFPIDLPQPPLPESSLPVSHEDNRTRYNQAFAHFHSALTRQEVDKLVLARKCILPLSAHFSAGYAFINACRYYPNAMIYLCHTPVSGLWMGCTPEILLSVKNGTGHTVSLAGTMPVLNDKEPMEWSRKNRDEQEFVSQYIRSCLAAHRLIVREEGPYTTRAAGVVHLKTDFFFHPTDTKHLGKLLADLHPTPAVCGLPKEKALELIHRFEALDRRYYAGFIGWTSPDNSTDLYVNLRCMEIRPPQAILYAGGGILPSSEADSEWEETEYKLKTIQTALTNSNE